MPTGSNDSSLLGHLLLIVLAVPFLAGFVVWLSRSRQRVTLGLVVLTALLQVPAVFSLLSDGFGAAQAPQPLPLTEPARLAGEEGGQSWTEPLGNGIQLQLLNWRMCGSSGCHYRKMLASSRVDAAGGRRYIDWIDTECSELSEGTCLDGIYPVNLQPGRLRHFWLLRSSTPAVIVGLPAGSAARKSYTGSYLLQVGPDGRFAPMPFTVSDLALASFVMASLPLLAYLMGRRASEQGALMAAGLGLVYWLIAYGNLIDLGSRGS